MLGARFDVREQSRFFSSVLPGGVPRPEVVGWGCKTTCLPTVVVTSCDFA